jgi:hypothetical protein
MRRVATPDDNFEWTVTEAPFAETAGVLVLESSFEPVAQLAAPESFRWLRVAINALRSVSGVLAAAVAAILLTVWLGQSAQRWMVEQTVRGTVTREEQAALAGDVAALETLSGGTDRMWLEQRLARASNGLSAPSPFPGLRPTRKPGTIQALTPLSPDLYQVEVTRNFALSDGREYAFVLSQFYQRTGEAWQRTAAPTGFWGAPTRLVGRFVELNFYTRDEEFATELLPYLDTLMTRFCAEALCPRVAPIALDLGHRYFQAADAPEARLGDPLLFSVLPPHVTRFPNYGLLIPSPNDAGYPADDYSRDLLQRAIGVRVLFAAIDRLAFSQGRREAVANAFMFALVVRQSERLGLESQDVRRLAPVTTPEHFTAEKLWGFRTGVWRRPDVLRNALSLLNGWLAHSSPEADLGLMRTLRTAPSLEAWLAAGTGQSEASVAVQVEAALARLDAAR